MLLRMLIENKRDTAELAKEHGMSLLIEFQGKRFLFDTGGSAAFLDNAAKLGLDLRDVDCVIISHSHSDHSGGLLQFLGFNDHAPVYISENAKKQCFVQLPFIKEDVSTPTEIFTEYPGRIRYVSGSLSEIEENVFLVSGFQRKYPLPKSNGKLLVKEDGGFRRDDFDHEIALVLDNGGKLVVLTGCSHNGVENMLETIIGRFPGKPIQSVIGGFHLIGFPFAKLMGESRSNIAATGKRLLGYGIDRAYTCHCSGDWGYSVLKETMMDRIEYFHTGMQVEL